MKSVKLPVDAAGWEHLVGSLVKAELKLAGMRYSDLREGLLEFGVDQSISNISGKLANGRFSAVFLLQSLVVIGVDEIVLPKRGGMTNPKCPYHQDDPDRT